MKNLDRLEIYIEEIKELIKIKYWSQKFFDWKENTENILTNIFWDYSEKLEIFKLIKFEFWDDFWVLDEIKHEKYIKWLLEAEKILKKYYSEIKNLNQENIQILENIFDKFTDVAKLLEIKFWKIDNEKDLQVLLHALLKLHFNDIRPEERNPSYGWKSSKSDFLLKNEKILIETKKTRDKLKDKEVWEEIILDISKYKWNSDCKILICFIYDPDWLIINPNWLRKDLEDTKDLDVRVYIKK